MKNKIALFFISLSAILWLYPISNRAYSPMRIFPNMELGIAGQGIDSPSEDGRYPLVLINSAFNLNFYQSSHLGYISFEPIRFNKDKNNFGFYISLGMGYRHILPSSYIVGSYLFWDIMSRYQYSHLNWGIEYFHPLSHWKLHTNFYIPIGSDYHQKTGIPLPQAFDIQKNELGQHLEQHYFLLKNNWGGDIKLIAQTPLPSIHGFGGLYSFYDQYAKQLMVGYTGGVEYHGYNYKLFVKASYDHYHNGTLTAGYHGYNVGTPSTATHRRLCIPRERHLASPFIKTKNVRKLQPTEAEHWRGIPVDLRPLEWRKAQAKAEREQKEKRQKEWADLRPTLPRRYTAPELTALTAACNFFSEHGPHISRKSTKKPASKPKFKPTDIVNITSEELISIQKLLLLKLHPDRHLNNKKRFTELFQELGKHIETFQKLGKLPR